PPRLPPPATTLAGPSSSSSFSLPLVRTGRVRAARGVDRRNQAQPPRERPVQAAPVLVVVQPALNRLRVEPNLESEPPQLPCTGHGREGHTPRCGAQRGAP